MPTIKPTDEQTTEPARFTLRETADGWEVVEHLADEGRARVVVTGAHEEQARRLYGVLADPGRPLPGGRQGPAPHVG